MARKTKLQVVESHLPAWSEAQDPATILQIITMDGRPEDVLRQLHEEPRSAVNYLVGMARVYELIPPTGRVLYYPSTIRVALAHTLRVRGGVRAPLCVASKEERWAKYDPKDIRNLALLVRKLERGARFKAFDGTSLGPLFPWSTFWLLREGG